MLLEEYDLKNLALELFMQDLRPFAAALGIDDTTIDHYRVYADDQDDKGTVRLLKILSEREGSRKERVCWTIKQIGYFSLAQAFLTGIIAEKCCLVRNLAREVRKLNLKL